MSIQLLEQELPRLTKELLQVAELQMAAYVEQFIDDHGPARGVRSTSEHWGLQSGRASRSLVPGQGENVSDIKVEGGRITLEYGSRVPYFKFLEEGTKFMPARPSLNPGIQKFLQEQWPGLVQEMIGKAAGIFNA